MLFAILISFVCQPGDKLQPTALVKLVERTKPSVVVISLEKTKATGIVVDVKGYILTVRHVVGAEKTCKIKMLDGKEYTATVIIADIMQDLALLKIDNPKGLIALPLVKVAAKQGEEVLMIGHPSDQRWSVARGIVSATMRDIEMPNGIKLKGLLQTTAPVNPGNLGGPLLNVKGEIIGIVVAVRVQTQEIGYAISAFTATAFLEKHLPK
jgi:serine protease Do